MTVISKLGALVMSFVYVVLGALLLGNVFAVQEGKSSSNACSRVLQTMISGPETCAQSYLATINEELKQKAPLLFTNQQAEVVSSFENTFGVNVAIYSPFPLGGSGSSGPVYCKNFPLINPPEGLGEGFVQFSNTGPYPITNASMSFKFTQTCDGGGSSPYLVLANQTNTPDFYYEDYVLAYGGTCSDTATANFNVADNGQNLANLDCSNYNQQLTIAPNTGSLLTVDFATYTAGKTFNDPFYLFFNGFGDCTFSFDSVTLNLCTDVDISEPSNGIFTYSEDMAKSNLNVPGFRNDDGVYYYTTIYRDSFGQELYVTISSNNINCGK